MNVPVKVEDDEQRGIPLSKVVNDAVALSDGNAPQDKDDNLDSQLNSRLFLSRNAGAVPSRIPFRPLMSSLESIRSISVGTAHVLCLTSLGVVYSSSYGDGDRDGVTSTSALLPIEAFLQNGPIIQVSVGSSLSAAIDADGTLYTWGRRFGSSASPTVITPRVVEAFKDYQVLQVSCGGSFMLVRAKKNGVSPTSVFSWGLLASGSTGLGRLELRPARISALDDEEICDVSAGESHGLAVSSSGMVFAWGSNADGQCGVTAGVMENHRGILENVRTPRMIEPFGIGPKARSVSAGLSTSAVIETDGRLSTWGGGGGNKAFLLGHGDGFDPSEYMCPIAGQDGKQEMVLAASGRAVANIARLSGCLKVPSFCKPRVVEGLKDSIIAKVDISSTLGAAITQTNRLYVWGGGGGEMTTSMTNRDTSEVTAIHTPMALSTESVVEIASSSMLGLLFASDGPALSNEVGGFLLAQRNQSDLADCRIITATGKALRCHSSVIACRSNVLREMVEHHQHGGAEENATIELLLPGIKEETALALLEYLYTDTISASQIISSLLTFRLLEAAETLQLPGLVEICHRCLLEDADFGMNATGGAAMHLSTLAQDFASALKDGIGSDVHIIARGGEIIPAHWSILTARSSFFREAHKQMSSSQRYKTATLQISESRQTIGRLLHYIYTCEIVGQCNEDLIEDLQSVDKYGVEAAKPLIASSLGITGENADEMYLLSKQTRSSLLQQRALQVLSQRTQDSGALSVESADAVSAWAKERRLLSTIPKEGFKTAMDELKRARKEEAERIKQVERDMAVGFGGGLPVPLLLVLATATVAVYVAVQYFGDDGGPVVMAANALFIGVALRYAHKALM